MPFLKDLRRRSKANFAANGSVHESEQSSNAASNNVHSPSSSTLSSANGFARPSPPIPRSVSHQSVSQLSDSPPAQAPSPATTNLVERRRSANSVYSSSMTTAPKVPISMYAPRVLSINENTWVNHKVLLIYGQAGPSDRPLDGTLVVNHHIDHFPPTSWQVTQTHFKALVHLCPGPNDIRLDFSSPKLVGNNAPNALHTSRIRINYLPLNNTPPLKLVILLGKDSPATFDSPPEKRGREGNDLETAIRKYRMVAHLWSAFTAEQMYRNGFGRRSFRFEEEYQSATLSSRDNDRDMRNEAKVHVIRSSRTVAEIRDPNVAQQNHSATRKNDLHAWATEAVQQHFKPKTHQTVHAAVLILDSHWDARAKLITGHAALGAGSGEVRVGIFGSQALHTYPKTIEEVVPALTDCTKTDTNHVAADGGEDSGQWWQAACIGFGAHLHEVGHALGCPHQRTGIMMHDYWTLNRTFVTAESYSCRTKQPGLRPCLPSSEPGWHRLDALRFATHPCFQMPFDPPMHQERDVQVWALEQGQFMVTAKTGISFIELFSEGQDLCDSWIEYLGREGADPPPKQLTLSESELRSHLPPDRRSKKLRMVVFSCGGENHDVQDISKASNKVKLSNGNAALLGKIYGASAMAGHQPKLLLMAMAANPRQLLVAVRIYHDFALNGIELVYESGVTELFGRQKGDGKPKEVSIDVRRGETLAGFYIRAGYWIDGVAVIMSSGRRSEVYGNAQGGIGYTLLPPRGYRLAGLHGTFAERIDGIGMIITR